jgi:hypothetical protein
MHCYGKMEENMDKIDHAKKGHIMNTVTYLLKTRTVEAEKQPLLGNGPYTCSRGMRHIRCDITQQ